MLQNTQEVNVLDLVSHFPFFHFYFPALRQVSLCRAGWLSLGDLPASTSSVLGLKGPSPVPGPLDLISNSPSSAKKGLSLPITRAPL